jgi:hypothetical protein
MLKNIRYEKVSPIGGISNLENRELEFQYTCDALSIIDQSASYLNTTIRVTHYTGVGTAFVETNLNANFELSNNIANNLFTRSTYSIQNNVVSTCNDISQVSFVHALLNNSAQKLANNHSTNPINLYKRWSDGGLTIANAFASNSLAIGLERLPVNVFSVCSDLPLFYGMNMIPGNVLHSVKFLFQNTYQDNIFVNNLNPIPATFKGFYVGNNAPVFAVGDTYIKIEIVDISVNFLVHEVLQYPKTSYNFKYFDYWSLLKPISSIKETIVIPLPIATTEIICFFRPADGTSINKDMNVFTTNNNNTANANLKRYNLRYNGANYPNQHHMLNFESVASQPRFDNSRLFYEFLDQTEDKVPNGSVFDLGLWSSNVIIYHKLESIHNNKDTNCVINLDFSNPPQNSQLVVICRVDKQLTFEYDSQGNCTKTESQELKN